MRLEGRAVAGAGSVVDGRLIHLVAFLAARRTARAQREPVLEIL